MYYHRKNYSRFKHYKKQPLTTEQKIYRSIVDSKFNSHTGADEKTVIEKTPKPLKSIPFKDRMQVAKLLLAYNKIKDFKSQYKGKNMSSKAQYAYHHQVQSLKRGYGYLSKDSQSKMEAVKNSINQAGLKEAKSQQAFDIANPEFKDAKKEVQRDKESQQEAYTGAIDDINGQLSDYIDKHHTPAFLLHTPKKDRFNYASYINQETYLNYLQGTKHRVNPDTIANTKKKAQQYFNQLTNREQSSVTNFQTNKPKVFNKLHFKARDYVSVPFNQDMNKFQNRLQHNIKTAIPLISRAKHPLTMSKLLNDYTMTQSNSKVDKKLRPIERKLYDNLNNTEKSQFVKNMKQWKTPEALDIVSESANNVINPSIKNKDDQFDAIKQVNHMHLAHTLTKNNMPVPLKTWVLLRYETQMNNQMAKVNDPYTNQQYNIVNAPKEIRIATDKAYHIHEDRKNIQASKRAQAQHGDLSQMLAGVGQEVKQTKQKQMQKQQWSDMDNKAHNNNSKPTINKKPTPQHKVSKQQILGQQQQGKSIK